MQLLNAAIKSASLIIEEMRDLFGRRLHEVRHWPLNHKGLQKHSANIFTKIWRVPGFDREQQRLLTALGIVGILARLNLLNF